MDFKSEFILDEAEASDCDMSESEVSSGKGESFINDESELSGCSVNYNAINNDRKLQTQKNRALKTQEYLEDSDEDMFSGQIPSSTPLSKESPIRKLQTEEEENFSEIDILPDQLVQPYAGEMDDDKHPTKSAVEKVTRYVYHADMLPTRIDDIWKNNLEKCKPKKIRKQRDVQIPSSDYLYIDMFGERQLRETMSDSNSFDLNLAKKKLRKQYPVFLTLTPGTYYCDKFNIITKLEHGDFVTLHQLVKEELTIPSNFNKTELNMLAKVAKRKARPKKNKKKLEKNIPGIIPFCISIPQKPGHSKNETVKMDIAKKKNGPAIIPLHGSIPKNSEHSLNESASVNGTANFLVPENIKVLHKNAKQPLRRVSTDNSKACNIKKRRLLTFNAESDSETGKEKGDESVIFVGEFKGQGTEKDEASSESSDSDDGVGVTEKEFAESNLKEKIPIQVTSKTCMFVDKQIETCSFQVDSNLKVTDSVVKDDTVVDVVDDMRDNELDIVKAYCPTSQDLRTDSMMKDDGADLIIQKIDMDSVRRAHCNLLACASEIYPAFVRYPFDKILKRYKTRVDDVDHVIQGKKGEEQIKLKEFERWFKSVQDYEQVGTCKLVLVENEKAECPVSIINCDDKGSCKGFPNKWTIVEFQAWVSAAIKMFHKGTKLTIEKMYDREMKKLNEKADEILVQITEKKEQFENMSEGDAHEICMDEITALRGQLDKLGKFRDIAGRHKQEELEMISFNMKETRFIKDGEYFIREDYEL